MKRPLLVDTNVLVDFFRGHKGAVTFVDKHADRIALSAVVVAELYASVRAGREQETLDEFVSICQVIPITAEIASSAGLLKRKFGKSHGVGLADAILAATAEAENAELATLNVKHYPMFKNLKPAYAKK